MQSRSKPGSGCKMPIDGKKLAKPDVSALASVTGANIAKQRLEYFKLYIHNEIYKIGNLF